MKPQMQYARMHKYPMGTQVEQKNGYVRVKISKDKWQGLGAYLLQKAGVKIGEGDRVFFADGDRLNRNVDNLRRIHFNTVKFVMLPKSRPIYIPKEAPMKVNEKKEYYKVAA